MSYLRYLFGNKAEARKPAGASLARDGNELQVLRKESIELRELPPGLRGAASGGDEGPTWLAGRSMPLATHEAKGSSSAGKHAASSGEGAAWAHAAGAHAGEGAAGAPAASSEGVAASSDEDTAAFCLRFMAHCLPHSPFTEGVQCPAPTSAFASQCGDGVWPCKLINALFAGTIDERAVNLPGQALCVTRPCPEQPGSDAAQSLGGPAADPASMLLHPVALEENMQLLHISASAVGCSLEGLGVEQLVQGQDHALLRLVLDVVTSGLMHQVEVDQLAWPSGEWADPNHGSSWTPREQLMQWMEACLLHSASTGCAPMPALKSRASPCTSSGAMASHPSLEQLQALLEQLLLEAMGAGAAEFHGQGHAPSMSSQPASSSAAVAAAAPAAAAVRCCTLLANLESTAAAQLKAAPGSYMEAPVPGLDARVRSSATDPLSMGPKNSCVRGTAMEPLGGSLTVQSSISSPGCFRLCPRDLRGGDPNLLMLGLAAAARASRGLPLWSPPSPGTPAILPSCGVPAALPVVPGAGAAVPAALARSSLNGFRVSLDRTSGGASSSDDSSTAQGSRQKPQPRWQAKQQSVLRKGRQNEGGFASGGPKQIFGGDTDDTTPDTQEERLLRMWLNSLDPRIKLTSLFDKSMQTGLPLLLAADAIQPGSVRWEEVFNLPFKELAAKIMAVGNCNQAVDICQSWGPLVNIGGIDIAEGRRMATLSLVWKMMRHHIALLLSSVTKAGDKAGEKEAQGGIQGTPDCTGAAEARQPELASSSRAPQVPAHQSPLSTDQDQTGLSAHQDLQCPGPPQSLLRAGGAPISPLVSLTARQGTSQAQLPPRLPRAQKQQERPQLTQQQIEVEVLRWANDRLRSVGHGRNGSTRIRNLADPRLADGQALLHLLAAISPRSINPEHVLPGVSQEERESNAKYIISVTRKLGCTMFLVWQDLLHIKGKSSLILLASLMALDLRLRRSSLPAAKSASICGSAM